MMVDMTLIIPIAASALAVTVVIVAVCIWVLKAKSRRNLERGNLIYTQSVVEIPKKFAFHVIFLMIDLLCIFRRKKYQLKMNKNN